MAVVIGESREMELREQVKDSPSEVTQLNRGVSRARVRRPGVVDVVAIIEFCLTISYTAEWSL